MKRAVIITSCLIASAALGGCRSADDPSPVIAQVNNNEIRLSEFERYLALKVGELKADGDADSLRSHMLDEYIRRRLMLDEAKRAGLAVTDEEIDQTAHDDPQFKSTAATADAREELISDLLIEKYFKNVLLRDVRVSPEDIQKYIDDNQSRLTDRPGFYVREIRVQSRDEAERLRQEVMEGRRDFAAVARLHSDAPTAERGGLARYEEGQLPKVLEKAIQPLRPGDVSAVVQSTYGFHMFKLEHRIQPRSPDERRSQYDEKRSQLKEEYISRINQQAVDEALSRLVASAVIEINDSALGFTYAGQFRQN